MSAAVNAPWFVRPRARPETGLRLLCFPHAGGAASAYHRWSTQLPAEVLAVQLPAREGRMREAPMRSLLSAAEAIVDAIQTDPLFRDPSLPCVFFGHSMGALLAYETVRILAARGHELPRALLVSGRAPPDHQPNEPLLHALPDADFVEELDRRFGGVPAILREEPELMALFLPILRADIEMLERHRHKAGEPLDVPILAFGGTEDHRARREWLEDWARFTRDWRGLVQLPGGHFFLHQPTSPFLPALSDALGTLQRSTPSSATVP